MMKAKIFLGFVMIALALLACGQQGATPMPTPTPIPEGENEAEIDGSVGNEAQGLPVRCGDAEAVGDLRIPAGSFTGTETFRIECVDPQGDYAQRLEQLVQDETGLTNSILGAVTLEPSPFSFNKDARVIIPFFRQREDAANKYVDVYAYNPGPPEDFSKFEQALVDSVGWSAEAPVAHFTTLLLVEVEQERAASEVSPTATEALVAPSTNTPTNTPLPPTATPTSTPVPPTPTNTPLPPTATNTPTNTPALTDTPALVAGQNLISNADFEQDPRTHETLWFVDRRNTDLTASWITTEWARSGKQVLSLSASKSGAQGWPGWFTTNTIPIIEGYTYTFSAWAYTPDGAGAWISVEMLDASGHFLLGRSTGCLLGPDIGNWNSRSVTVSASDAPGATQVRLGLQQCLNFTEGSMTNLFYDDVFFGVLPP